MRRGKTGGEPADGAKDATPRPARRRSKPRAKAVRTVKPRPHGWCDKRICVSAPMPVLCPHCKSSDTTAANGVHYNLHFGVRYEHRICNTCHFSFTASRSMTETEKEQQAARSPNFMRTAK